MNTIEKILVAIDHSVMAEEALKRAILLAKLKSAELMVIHVIEPDFMESPFMPTVDEAVVKRQLKEQLKRVLNTENLNYTLFIESGSAADSIIHVANKTQADLLIIGTHGKDNLESHYFSSTTLSVVQETHIPVLIVKNKVLHQYAHLLAPTDLSDVSKESIQFSRRFFDRASLKYLHAYITSDTFQSSKYSISMKKQNQFKQELLLDAQAALEKFIKKTAKGELELLSYHNSINEELLTAITKQEADVLVLGSEGVGDINSFVLGSTASYLMQKSPMDVLLYVPQ